MGVVKSFSEFLEKLPPVDPTWQPWHGEREGRELMTVKRENAGTDRERREDLKRKNQQRAMIHPTKNVSI